MKIEEAFRDLKSRLGMVNLMSKTRENAGSCQEVCVSVCVRGAYRS
jgi:hypothetical protein